MLQFLLEHMVEDIMGQVEPFSRRALVLLVTEVQQFSLDEYIDSIMHMAERRHRDYDLIFCDGSDKEELKIKGLKNGAYQEVWCFGEYANELAFSICESARAKEISVHNLTRAGVAAHLEYAPYATNSERGAY